ERGVGGGPCPARPVSSGYCVGPGWSSWPHDRRSAVSMCVVEQSAARSRHRDARDHPMSTKYEAIMYHVADAIATVTLNRPEVHNAMNDVMRRELTRCFDGLVADDDVKVVVVTGAGEKAFSAGARIPADEALRIGLVERVVPAGEALKATLELARAMAAKAPVALRYAKEAVVKGLELPLADGLRLEGDLSTLLRTTEDRVEGAKAFL